MSHEVEAQTGKNIESNYAQSLMTKIDLLVTDMERGTLIADQIDQRLDEIASMIENATKDQIKDKGTKTSLLAKLGKSKGANKKTTGDLQAINFDYDKNGNRIQKEFAGPPGPKVQGSKYSYDFEDRLTKVQDYQGNSTGTSMVNKAVTSISYDGLGRKLRKSYSPSAGAQGKTTHYVFDNLDPIAEYSTWNKQYTNYYRGDANNIAVSHNFPTGTAGQKYYFAYDALNSVVGVTKQSGQSNHNYRYSDFGNVVPSTGNFTEPHNQFTYTGQLWDSNTGLYEFYSRAYDPGTGVWLQHDHYRGQLSDPMSLHRYMYVKQNPINLRDLYGFSEEDLYKQQIIDGRYMIGRPQRPDGSTPLVAIPEHDKGFEGEKQSPNLKDYLYASSFWAPVARASFLGKFIGIGQATSAYNHYWYGDGKDRTTDAKGFFKDDKSGQVGLENLILDAQKSSENLYKECSKNNVRGCNLTSGVYTFGLEDGNDLHYIYPFEASHYPYPASFNWQRTLGSFYLWNSGRVYSTACTTEGTTYRLDLTIHIEDKYNFNPGYTAIGLRNTNIGAISDKANGRWEELGWAEGYMNYSEINLVIEWTEGKYDTKKVTGL